MRRSNITPVVNKQDESDTILVPGREGDGYGLWESKEKPLPGSLAEERRLDEALC